MILNEDDDGGVDDIGDDGKDNDDDDNKLPSLEATLLRNYKRVNARPSHRGIV